MGVLETQLLHEKVEALVLELEQKQEQVEQLQTQAVSSWGLATLDLNRNR